MSKSPAEDPDKGAKGSWVSGGARSMVMGQLLAASYGPGVVDSARLGFKLQCLRNGEHGGNTNSGAAGPAARVPPEPRRKEIGDGYIMMDDIEEITSKVLRDKKKSVDKKVGGEKKK